MASLSLRRIGSLEEKISRLTPEVLAQNDTFVSTLLHASQVAQRTHQKEKLEALRNTVLNSALPNAPDDDIQLMFVNFIDALTPWHLRILQYLRNPRAYGEARGIVYPNWETGSAAAVLEHTFPQLDERKDFTRQVIKDLSARGSISADTLGGLTSARGMFGSYTTDFGKQFLDFITLPLAEDVENASR